MFINFQKTDKTNDDYLKEFQVLMAMLDDYSTNIVDLVPCLIEETSKDMYETTVNLGTPEELKNAKKYVFKRGSATLLLIQVDQGCYETMKNHMQQNTAMGTNNYPKLVDERMNILNTLAKTIKVTYEKIE